MILEHARRPDKGVTTLQYVGDDEPAVDLATRKDVDPVLLAAIAGGAASVLAPSATVRDLGDKVAKVAGAVLIWRWLRRR